MKIRDNAVPAGGCESLSGKGIWFDVGGVQAHAGGEACGLFDVEHHFDDKPEAVRALNADLKFSDPAACRTAGRRDVSFRFGGRLRDAPLPEMNCSVKLCLRRKRTISRDFRLRSLLSFFR